MSSSASPRAPSRTAQIRALAKSDRNAAEDQLAQFLADTFGITVDEVCINYDQYSLNSLNGFFQSAGKPYFFKFHQEEGEEDMKGEYYRAELLAQANLPVDLPVWKSSLPGEQILVYARRDDRRFSDVLRALDEHPDAEKIQTAAAAERDLNSQILDVAVRTVHIVDTAQVAEEPFHHLFYDRMIDLKTGRSPGGRYQSYYIDQNFQFPGSTLTWDQFSNARLCLNGVDMASTIGEVFQSAVQNLNPKNLATAGGITAHGDAHNANVWYVEQGDSPRLTFFDPAFAGLHVPSLLAEIKATFHNIFAHPFWLYDPEIAQQRFTAHTTYADGVLSIDTDWQLSAARHALLEAKIDSFWRPFLRSLADRKMLPANWQDIMRSAMAMCPALVMNLRADADRHNMTSSAIGFYVVGLAGSVPVDGKTIFTEFFRRIDPHVSESSR